MPVGGFGWPDTSQVSARRSRPLPVESTRNESHPLAKAAQSSCLALDCSGNLLAGPKDQA
jgi:hypothetical protein